MSVHRHGRVFNEEVLQRMSGLCHSFTGRGSEGWGRGDDPGAIGADTLSVTLTLLTRCLWVFMTHGGIFKLFSCC